MLHSAPTALTTGAGEAELEAEDAGKGRGARTRLQLGCCDLQHGNGLRCTSTPCKQPEPPGGHAAWGPANVSQIAAIALLPVPAVAVAVSKPPLTAPGGRAPGQAGSGETINPMFPRTGNVFPRC